jgi:hypothetical protein
MTQILAQIRGVEVGFNDFGGPAIDCAPGVACPLPAPGVAPDVGNGVAGHFWPRIAVTLGAIAVLLTLVSMRLIVPAGMRFVFRRRRRAALPAVEPGAGESMPEPPTPATPSQDPAP